MAAQACFWLVGLLWAFWLGGWCLAFVLRASLARLVAWLCLLVAVPAPCGGRHLLAAQWMLLGMLTGVVRSRSPAIWATLALVLLLILLVAVSTAVYLILFVSP